MRNWLITTLLLTGITVSSTATASCNDELQITYDIAAGYRKDHLKYRKGGFDDQDNPIEVQTRYTFEDVQSYVLFGSTKIVTPDRIYLRLSGDYGHIYHGRFRQKDVIKFREEDAEDFEIDIVDAHSHANKGEVFDLSLGLGYHFSFLADRVTLAPMLGYGLREQHFRMHDLVVELDLIDFNLGEIPNFHSNYRTRWNSFWLGMDMTFWMTKSLWLSGTAEFHWNRFRGKAHWNLRDEFIKDVQQRAFGWGQLYHLGLHYDFCFGRREWSLGLLGEYQTWHTREGRNREFLIGGHTDYKLHPVHWHSWSLMADLKYIY